MRTETATHAKHQFGRILEESMHEPIVIQKSGRNVAVMLSFETYQHLRQIENEHWIKKSNTAKKEGFIGTKASQKLIQALLHAED